MPGFGDGEPHLAERGARDASAASIVVDHVPTIGQIVKADGSIVTAGTTLTSTELAGLKYVPPADYNGHDPVGQFDYTVTDGGRTASGSVDVNLAAVNDVPVAVADIASTAEDTPLAGNLLANDHDADGDTLSVTQFSVGGSTFQAGTTATIAGVGTVTIHADGSFEFTPAPNYNGQVPVIGYTVSDGTASAQSTLTIGVGAFILLCRGSTLRTGWRLSLTTPGAASSSIRRDAVLVPPHA